MKSSSFIFDRRLHELLQQGRYDHFTTRELRDAYAEQLAGTAAPLSDLRRYVYEQIRRMLRVGWVTQDAERRTRGQVYHLQPIPEGLNLELVDVGFEHSRCSESASLPEQVRGEVKPDLPKPAPDATERLAALLKEIRLDFLSAMGEAERFKQLLEEMPHIIEQVEGDYLEARDRSSRLLGHLRAVEKTLKILAAKQ